MAGNCDDLVAKAKDAVELVLRIGYGIPAGRLGPVISLAAAKSQQDQPFTVLLLFQWTWVCFGAGG